MAYDLSRAAKEQIYFQVTVYLGIMQCFSPGGNLLPRRQVATSETLLVVTPLGGEVSQVSSGDSLEILLDMLQHTCVLGHQRIPLSEQRLRDPGTEFLCLCCCRILFKVYLKCMEMCFDDFFTLIC